MPQTTSLDQLRRALEAGLIDQATFDAAVAGIHIQAGGAIAQGTDALAVGAGGVAVQGDNNGVINLGLLIQQGSRPGASPDELRRAYLARILGQVNHLPLYAGDTGNAQIRLSSIYTALLTQRGGERWTPADTDKKLSALDVLNGESRIVLLGGPGSGKSTFVNFVALSLAGESLGAASPNLASLTAPIPTEDTEEEQPQRWDHGALLPVRILLRELVGHLPPPGQPVNAETVWRYLREQLRQAALEPYAEPLREALLQGRALVLLDGLDEVADAHDRRVQIKDAVVDFAASFSRCRYLVTSRTYAYQKQHWKLPGFSEVHLLPFTSRQIQCFVKAWYAHMVELLRLDEAGARDRVEVLERAVERNPRIRELAERPLLLTLIAQLQTEGGGSLPENREELYDKAVEMLLNKWENLKIRVRADGTKEIEPSLAEWLDAGRDKLRRALNRLAYEAHRDQPRDEHNPAATADIPQDKLIAALLRASARPDEVKVSLLEKYLRDRAGLLAEHGGAMYQFPHRSFQEYLAACHLTDDEFPDKLASLARSDPDRWREVALLAGAKAVRGSEPSAWLLAETLCPKAPTADAVAADYWGALLAGRVLVESADLAQVAPRDEEKRERVRQWQRAILRGGVLPATERALAGRSLAVLGDPRPEVMTLDGMQFCCLPPGRFVMGSERYDDEKPQHPVDLDYPCCLARYPVSVAQWREYVKRSGKAPDDADSPRGRDNDPVVNVSFHDALRFCDYLTEAWRGVLPEGWVVTLPSEAEWEKAVRGGKHIPATPGCLSLEQVRERVLAEARRRVDKRSASTPTQPAKVDALSLIHPTATANPLPGRDYPWGEGFDGERANVESAIGETSVLGAYPAGTSPYGCEEMSGNVWEWTRSLWGTDWKKPQFTYPYDPADNAREILEAGDDMWRVVRGGAWRLPRGFARCASRSWSRPGPRDGGLGFRVVLSPVRRL